MDTQFCPDDVFTRARMKLRLEAIEGVLETDMPLPQGENRAFNGDHRLDLVTVSWHPPAVTRAAAVLVGLAAHEAGVNVILTTRASTLKTHAGQIAFPGGKIETYDADPVAAALREAWEEIGLEPSNVEPIGYLDPYLTGTNFLIYPIVAKVTPPFTFKLDPREVADVFEVPLSFLMNAEHHILRSRDFDGVTRQFYAMPYLEREIWGATAGIIRDLYERLYV